MTSAEPSAAQPGPIERWVDYASGVIRASGPPLLFGLRLWASVCLALYVAFWLELPNAQWAGTSAAIVCQPHLGASLRKGWFRLIGTVIGAVAIVVMTACFPQDRGAFLVSLALWGAACALVATLLRNFAAYAAALAGYTAAIIASDQLGQTGGLNGEAFMLAVYRASEICIGIVCAGVKSILDVGATLERLESFNVTVIGYGTDRFPGFYLADSGFPLDWRVDSPKAAADVIRAQLTDAAIVIANPIPSADQLPPDVHNRVLEDALRAAAEHGIRGKSITPFLLETFRRETAGASLEVNLKLVRANVRLATQIAAAL